MLVLKDGMHEGMGKSRCILVWCSDQRLIERDCSITLKSIANAIDIKGKNRP